MNRPDLKAINERAETAQAIGYAISVLGRLGGA